jgi:hypothetical protein
MSLYDEQVTTNIWTEKLPLKIILDPAEIEVYGADKIYDPIHVRTTLCTKIEEIHMLILYTSWKSRDVLTFL